MLRLSQPNDWHGSLLEYSVRISITTHTLLWFQRLHDFQYLSLETWIVLCTSACCQACGCANIPLNWFMVELHYTPDNHCLFVSHSLGPMLLFPSQSSSEFSSLWRTSMDKFLRLYQVAQPQATLYSETLHLAKLSPSCQDDFMLYPKRWWHTTSDLWEKIQCCAYSAYPQKHLWNQRKINSLNKTIAVLTVLCYCATQVFFHISRWEALFTRQTTPCDSMEELPSPCKLYHTLIMSYI